VNTSGMSTNEIKQVAMKEPELTVCKICGEPDTSEFCTCPPESKAYIKELEKSALIALIKKDVCAVIGCAGADPKMCSESPQTCGIVRTLYLGFPKGDK
jgi:hypothetical protein